MKLLILTLSFLLSGCFYQTITENDMRKAETACEGRDNVDSVSANFAGQELVTCRNGEARWLK